MPGPFGDSSPSKSSGASPGPAPAVVRGARAAGGALPLLLALLAIAAPAPAGATVRLLLHAAPPPPSADLKCELLPLTDCRNAVTSAPLSTPTRPGEWIYVLLTRDADDPQIGGVGFGISYQDDKVGGRLDGKGVDIWSWEHCGEATMDLVSGRPWPDPGGALYLRWRQSTRCVRGAVGVAGYFYVSAYSSDTIKLRGALPPEPRYQYRNTPRVVHMHDCPGDNGYGFAPGALGTFDFSDGAAPGCNPCLEPCQLPPPPQPPPPPHPNGEPRLAVVVAPPPIPVPSCPKDRHTTPPPCAGYKTSGLSGPEGVGQYLVVLASRNQADLLAGVQFGIEYDGGDVPTPDGHGVDIVSWTTCGDAEYPMPGVSGPAWPSSGSANRIVWYRFQNCQWRDPAVVGYFYVAAHAPGTFQLTGHPLDRELALIADCQSAETTVPARNLGRVAFSDSGTVAGCNPCDTECPEVSTSPPPILTPVTRTTWSRIKVVLPGETEPADGPRQLENAP
jgi:hypothetical protein